MFHLVSTPSSLDIAQARTIKLTVSYDGGIVLSRAFGLCSPSFPTTVNLMCNDRPTTSLEHYTIRIQTLKSTKRTNNFHGAVSQPAGFQSALIVSSPPLNVSNVLSLYLESRTRSWERSFGQPFAMPESTSISKRKIRL
jgi:hypothetical protein